MAKILDGRATALEMRKEVAVGVEALRRDQGLVPGLAVVLAGDDPASAVYVRNKARACERAGILSKTVHLSADTSQEELLWVIEEVNGDERYHGILVQLPLPAHMDEGVAIRTISPDKDVDCIHPLNVGLLSQGVSDFLPATPGGIQQLLVRNGISTEGKHAVICGRSNIVGKPLAIMLAQKQAGANATVTVCHTGTADLGHVTREADILVAAVGRAGAITANMVKDGAVVIDVGINRVDDSSRKSGYRLVGDVDFAGVFEKASAITPVPGGVGPMTIAMLLVNTVTAAKKFVALQV